MEHYQSTCTPQPSVSKLPPITPALNKENLVVSEETNLPPELCMKCNHGFQVCICTPFHFVILTCLEQLGSTYAWLPINTDRFLS